MESSEHKTQCSRCGRHFELGDRIYPIRIWILGRNLCLLCKDATISFIDTHPKNPSLKPLVHDTI